MHTGEVVGEIYTSTKPPVAPWVLGSASGENMEEK